MSFAYNRMSEEEAIKAAFSLLEDGIYDFELVKDGVHGISKKGNPLIKLMLKVWDKEGKEKIVYDNLIGMKNFEFKTRHFCYTAGLHKEYENNNFNETLCVQGLRGKAHIVIDPERTDNSTGQTYPPKNAVKDYIVPGNATLQSQKISHAKNTPNDAQVFDDDIPF